VVRADVDGDNQITAQELVNLICHPMDSCMLTDAKKAELLRDDDGTASNEVQARLLKRLVNRRVVKVAGCLRYDWVPEELWRAEAAANLPTLTQYV
jgi:hypothetical protein